MRKRWLGIFALCILGCFSRAGALSNAEAQAESIPDDYVVVQLAGGVSAEAQVDGGKSPTFEELGYRTLPVPKGMSRDAFLAQLRAQPGIISAEPDDRVYAADNIPNDTLYLANQAKYMTQIGAPAAWDIETGSSKVVVAVIDSGIDLSHPDLAPRLWTNPADSFADGVDHDGNGCVNDIHGCRFVQLTTENHLICGYSDDNGTGSGATGRVNDDSGSSLQAPHGTFVSGLIGAAGGNGIGLTGIDWNVQLMAVKVLDCGSGDGRAPSGQMSDVVKGILYAVRMGANVINISLASRLQIDDTSALRSAIQVAQSQGVIIVAAAGNYGNNSSQPGPGYPGAYTEFPNLITVGAADQNNGMRWESFSAYGPALDFAAPGGPGLSSTGRSDLVSYVTDNNGGTSFATPLVSGMFALMMSRNSHLGAADYIQIAKDTATPAPPAPHGQNWAGAGIINVGAAVAKVPMSINGSPLRDWKDVPGGTEMRASVDGNDCGSTKTVAIGPAGQFDIRVKSALEQPGCGAPGKTVQLSIGGVPAEPTFTWGGLNVDLGVSGKDVSTVSPPPGAVVVQALNGSWSNIAFFEASGNLPSAFGSLPTPWTAAYHWDATRTSFTGTPGAFQHFIRNAPAILNDWNSVQTYDTFWVDAPATNIASLNPNPPPGRVLQLKQGWNNFVYTGTSKEVEDALAAIAGKYSEVVQYDNASKAWLVHTPNQPRRFLNDFGGLFTLKVYWIYMTDDGAITMD